ncbi:MurR/RpiR family transcriptional regulator [Paenibacillus sp. GCM10027626]|uniref:MurR/RpiR family transcriptional regulator n=1 Tax=Paenibacillus sp. GCM10027626 TaxID=3273411 RepID=UPI003641A073
MSGLLIRMEEAFPLLTAMEKKAARYILDHPKSIVNLSVQSLAKLANVSESTLVRLSRSMQCKGFQELKLKIAADLALSDAADSNADEYQDIQFDDSIPNLIASISRNNIKSIQDTQMISSIKEMEQAIQVLRSARKIAVFGIGASAIIAEDFKFKLTRINRWCESAYSFDMQAVIAANLNKEDAVLGISYSGQTEETIRSLEIAKENGAAIISLTKFGNNPVAELADIRLFVSSLEKSIRSGAMASRIAQMNIIDILFVGIAAGQAQEAIQSLERTRKAVSWSKRTKG